MGLATASVTRSLDLPVSLEEAWSSIGDADGLAGWLGDSVELDQVAAGVAGIVRDGDVVRRLVVTEVDAGRSVGFVWWDESRPEQASVVTIELSPSEDATSTTVTVTERIAGAATASFGAASVSDLLDVEAGWDARLQALVGTSAFTAALV